MQQFLFVVDMPLLGCNEEWISFENESNTILKSAISYISTQIHPHKNIWLLPAENLLPVLTNMTVAANKHEYPYSVFLIDNATDISAKKSQSAQTPTIKGL